MAELTSGATTTEDGTGAYLITSGPKADKIQTASYIAHALKMCGAAKPRLAYIGTATDDSLQFLSWVEPMLVEAGAGAIDLVSLAREDADIDAAKKLLADADAVFVSGGDPARGMEWLCRHEGICDYLRELFAEGKLFCGISAGPIMMGERWFAFEGADGGWSSVDPGDGSAARLIDCLGLVPYSFDAHGEEEGWADLRRMLSLMGPGEHALGLPLGGMAYCDRDGVIYDLAGMMPVFENRDGLIVEV